MEKMGWNVNQWGNFRKPKEDDLTEILKSLPQVGYQNEKGILVLPADYDDPEDSVYDEL